MRSAACGSNYCDSNQYNFWHYASNFKNIRGHWNNWLMPADMLSSDCNELRSEVTEHGLYLNHKFKPAASILAIATSQEA